MKNRILPVGILQTNCYLVFIENSRTLYIIDPGGEPDLIVAASKDFPYSNVRILLTHAHFDHLGGAGKVAKLLNVKTVELRFEDWEIYHSPDNCMPPYCPQITDLPKVSEIIPAPELKVLPLPGHTPGGSGFLFTENGQSALYCGDTLFSGSIGRTDLPGGNYRTLLNSIKNELMVLPDDLTVYPGHEGITSIGEERKHNPFIREEY